MFSRTGSRPIQVSTSAFTTEIGMVVTSPLYSPVRRLSVRSTHRWRGSQR